MTDETKRHPASQNPWYILMTIAGEQGGVFDRELHEKNRRFWHGWLAQGLADEVKADLIVRDVVAEAEFAPFDADESIYWKNEIERRGLADLPNQDEGVNFSDCDFETNFLCDGFYLKGYADFESATFSGDASFVSATFPGYASFESATFSGDAFFWSATFSGAASFRSATFSRDADFQSATFSGAASFRSATFSRDADFQSATFSRDASFGSAKLEGDASFGNATFSGPVVFTSAELSSSVSFEDVVFGADPPAFFGAELHEDTTWLVKSWAPVPRDPRKAYDHRRAYERLKLLMDSQKKTHDEHMFHRLELKCREAEEGWLASIPSRLYGLVSDYGWSFMRPFSFLLLFTSLGYWWFMRNLADLGGCPAALGATLWDCRWTVFALSLSNLFGFLGLGRAVLKDEIDALDDFGWFEIGAGLQFFCGAYSALFSLSGASQSVSDALRLLRLWMPRSGLGMTALRIRDGGGLALKRSFAGRCRWSRVRWRGF